MTLVSASRLISPRKLPTQIFNIRNQAEGHKCICFWTFFADLWPDFFYFMLHLQLSYHGILVASFNNQAATSILCIALCSLFTWNIDVKIGEVYTRGISHSVTMSTSRAQSLVLTLLIAGQGTAQAAGVAETI